MPRLELRPFADEYLDAAAALLAERHRRHRAAEPLLSPRYEDAAAARVEIEELWRTDGASGAVALASGDVAGYLLAAPRDASWGANMWIEAAGHGVREAETVRDLYAFAAAAWVDGGRTAHYAIVPATDAALVDAWFRLGFGAQHAHGIVQAATARVDAPRSPAIEIRRATPTDVDAAVQLEHVLPEHQSGSPVFSLRPYTRASDDDVRAEWIETIEDERLGTYLAFRDGRVVGGIVGAPIELSSTHGGVARPDGACLLGWAATVPEERGGGVGLALTDAFFAWARACGYAVIAVDWRETNLLSSRFWPARGFRRTFLRLYRSIP